MVDVDTLWSVLLSYCGLTALAATCLLAETLVWLEGTLNPDDETA